MKAMSTSVFRVFQMVKLLGVKSPATAVTVPGGGRTVLESGMANSSPPGGGA